MSNHNLHKLVLQKFKVKIDTTISYAIQYKKRIITQRKKNRVCTPGFFNLKLSLISIKAFVNHHPPKGRWLLRAYAPFKKFGI